MHQLPNLDLLRLQQMTDLTRQHDEQFALPYSNDGRLATVNFRWRMFRSSFLSKGAYGLPHTFFICFNRKLTTMQLNEFFKAANLAHHHAAARFKLMDYISYLGYGRSDSGPFVVYGLDKLEARLNVHFCRRAVGVSNISIRKERDSGFDRMAISYLLHMMYWYDNVIGIINRGRAWKVPRSVIDDHGYMNPVPA